MNDAAKVFANASAFSSGAVIHLSPTFKGGMLVLGGANDKSSRFISHHCLDTRGSFLSFFARFHNVFGVGVGEALCASVSLYFFQHPPRALHSFGL